MSRVRNRYPRIPCVVPFCGCGATCYPPDEASEIICPKHYRLVDRKLKALRRMARAAAVKAGRTAIAAHGPDRRAAAYRAWRMWMLTDRLWNRMRDQAITRAAGAPL